MTRGVEFDVLVGLCQHLQDILHNLFGRVYAHWKHAVAILEVVVVQLLTTFSKLEIDR